MRAEEFNNRQDKFYKNNDGYSLIELIIVIAILAVIMGVAMFSVSMVFSANAKACANDIQRAIADCKVTTMGKADAYMEIYRDANGNLYSQMHVTQNGAVEDMEPEKLGSSKVTVTYTLDDGTTGELTAGGSRLTVKFDRASGSFAAGTCQNIEVRGGTKHYRITLIQLTGKSTLEAVP